MNAKIEQSDAQLLKQYAEQGNEASFAVLAEKYGSLVYGACRRITGEDTLAEEASQAAFLVLARKSRKLLNQASVGGWLFRTARFCALNAVKMRKRRQTHEKEAGIMKEQIHFEDPPEVKWEQVSPYLDSGLASLSGPLRDAVVTRLLRGLNEEEASRELGISRSAVSVRLTRAMKKLRSHFVKKGITVPAALLGVLIGANALEAVPLSFTPVPIAAGTGAAAASGSVLIAESVMKTMMWMKLKMAVVYAAAVLVLAGGIGVPAVLSLEEQKKQDLELKKEVKLGKPEVKEDESYPDPVKIIGRDYFQGENNIVCIAFSPDSKYMATGYNFGNIGIWELESRKLVQRVTAPGRLIMSVAFSENGDKLYYRVNIDGMLKDTFVVYSLKEKKELRSIAAPGHSEGFTLSAGENTVIFNCPRDPDPVDTSFEEKITGVKREPSEWEKERKRELAAINRTGVAAWDLRTGKQLWRITNVARTDIENCNVTETVLDESGKVLICTDNAVGRRGRVRFTLWDLAEKKKKSEWFLPNGYNAEYGYTIAWGLHDTSIFISKVKHNKKTVSLLADPENGDILREFSGTGALSRDRKSIFAYDGDTIVKYNAETGDRKEMAHVGRQKDLNRAWLSPDERWFCGTQYSSTVFAADLEKGYLVSPSDAGFKRRPEIYYASDGHVILCGGTQTRVVDDLTGSIVNTLRIPISYSAASGGNTSIHSQGKTVYQRVGVPGEYDGNKIPESSNLMLFRGGSDHRAQLWDVTFGKKIRSLPSGGGEITNTFVSLDGMFACTRTVRNAFFYDLQNGQTLFSLNGTGNGPFMKSGINSVKWDTTGEVVFISDSVRSWVNSTSADPIGHTGAFDSRTGELLFRFKNPDGSIIDNAAGLELHEGKNLVFMGVFNNQNNAYYTGLWSAVDGTFLRKAEKFSALSMGRTQFTRDGSKLIGLQGILEVETGKIIKRFSDNYVYIFKNPKSIVQNRWISPSLTQYIEMNRKENTLNLIDLFTGIKVWECTVDAEGTVPDISVLKWHPAETQVALGLHTSPVVLMVDICSLYGLKPEDKSDDELIQDIGSEKKDTFTHAIQALVLKNKKGLPVIEKLFQGSDLQKRRAVFVLEWLAREGNPQAREMLVTLGDGEKENILTTFALEALQRLKRVEKVGLLRKLKTEKRSS